MTARPINSCPVCGLAWMQLSRGNDVCRPCRRALRWAAARIREYAEPLPYFNELLEAADLIDPDNRESL